MLGLTATEMQAFIEARMNAMDEAQEEEEHLGQFGELMRMAAMIGFQRAAELIEANNQRLTEQLRAAGLSVSGHE